MSMGEVVAGIVGMTLRMRVAVGMVGRMGLGRGRNHQRTLYYNITNVYRPPPHGLPSIMAMAAARNGNGTETAQRNQTKRAGMKGISHRITRWKANSAQATT